MHRLPKKVCESLPKNLVITNLALPNRQHFPAKRDETHSDPGISCSRAVTLLAPKLGVRRRANTPVLAGVRMPEAAVDHDGFLSTREHDVRCAGQGTVVDTIPIAGRVKASTDDHFRSSIFRLDLAHVSPALFGAVYVQDALRVYLDTDFAPGHLSEHILGGERFVDIDIVSETNMSNFPDPLGRKRLQASKHAANDFSLAWLRGRP